MFLAPNLFATWMEPMSVASRPEGGPPVIASMQVRAAGPPDIPALARLRAALWPEGTAEEHTAELEPQLRSTVDCTLVAEATGEVVAFLEGRLRSHADGCETSPVAYLEGWFVLASWRGHGIGRALVERFEAWARERGCRELASDTWLENTDSQRAHERLGFREVDRVVTYRKALDPDVVRGPRARPPIEGATD